MARKPIGKRAMQSTWNERYAYCGCSEDLTTEHVVPTALYPPSKKTSRVQRITVRACGQCNGGWSDDEAHFRNILTLCGEPTPVVRELWEGKIRRSFDHVDGRKRVRNLFARMVPRQTPQGDIHMIYPAQDERVMRIVRKIVRGFCHHCKLLSPVHDGQVDGSFYSIEHVQASDLFCFRSYGKSRAYTQCTHVGWKPRAIRCTAGHVYHSAQEGRPSVLSDEDYVSNGAQH